MQSIYQNLWIREYGSKITDTWVNDDDHKFHTSDMSRKEKSVKELVIYDSKFNPKLSKICKICNDCRRKENERLKRGEFKEEWYWNGHLLRRKTDHVSTPAKTACSADEDSD